MGSNINQPLKVVIVGAGIGGLACGIACRRQGFDVTIYDQVKEFLRIGDSIGFGNNSARLLHRWGVADQLEAIASKAGKLEMFNYTDSDTCLGYDDQIEQFEKKTGIRALVGHRGDFHIILRDFCEKQGARIFNSTKVVSYDTTRPSLTLESGEEVTADVIICADGAKSESRMLAIGVDNQPLSSGYAIYRGYMDADLIRGDPVAGKFVEKSEDRIRVFLGPDMHGFINTLRDGTQINAVLTHKDKDNIDDAWTKEAKKEDIMALLEGWDPAVQRVWEVFPSCLDWKLVYRPCLDKWVADSGLVTLMGDACHPFLPTSTQGASQAIEDGATLAMCLGKVGRDEIPVALHTFFEIRHDYVAAAQRTGIEQRDIYHNVHDKESKELKKDFDVNTTALSNTHLWENDAEKVVEEKWDEISAKVRKQLKSAAA